MKILKANFLPTAYTDGSLLDPDVEHFQRAGMGFFCRPLVTLQRGKGT